MADTRALRQHIERCIIELQEKLKMIDTVEALASDLSAETPATATLTTLPPPAPVGPRPPVEVSEQDSMPSICNALLKDDWKDLDYFVPAVLRIRPGATRAAVSVGLRRLAERGAAEVRSKGSRKEGNEYRRPQ